MKTDAGLRLIAITAAVTLAILIAMTFGPAAWRAFWHREPIRTTEQYVQSASAASLYATDVGAQADAAKVSETALTLFSGGPAAARVVLNASMTYIPLSVSQLEATKVRFHGNGSVAIVAAGAWTHSAFSLSPLPSGGVDAMDADGGFAKSGSSAGAYLSNMKDNVQQSPCWTLALANPGVTLHSHDMSGATASPVVPEIAKVADLQAFSVAFSAARSDDAGVLLLVVPRRAGVPPLGLQLAFAGNDLVLSYALMRGAQGMAPAAMRDYFGSQSARKVTLRSARSGNAPVTVLAQLGRGIARVVSSENQRDRSYAVSMPALLADADTLRTNVLDPPAVMVTPSRTVNTLVVPFAVGDLAVLAGVLGA